MRIALIAVCFFVHSSGYAAEFFGSKIPKATRTITRTVSATMKLSRGKWIPASMRVSNTLKEKRHVNQKPLGACPQLFAIPQVADAAYQAIAVQDSKRLTAIRQLLKQASLAPEQRQSYVFLEKALVEEARQWKTNKSKVVSALEKWLATKYPASKK